MRRSNTVPRKTTTRSTARMGGDNATAFSDTALPPSGARCSVPMRLVLTRSYSKLPSAIPACVGVKVTRVSVAAAADLVIVKIPPTCAEPTNELNHIVTVPCYPTLIFPFGTARLDKPTRCHPLGVGHMVERAVQRLALGLRKARSILVLDHHDDVCLARRANIAATNRLLVVRRCSKVAILICYNQRGTPRLAHTLFDRSTAFAAGHVAQACEPRIEEVNVYCFTLLVHRRTARPRGSRRPSSSPVLARAASSKVLPGAAEVAVNLRTAFLRATARAATDSASIALDDFSAHLNISNKKYTRSCFISTPAY